VAWPLLHLATDYCVIQLKEKFKVHSRPQLPLATTAGRRMSARDIIHIYGRTRQRQIVGSGLRKIDPEKVKAVQEMKNPETKKQLRRVLGYFGYFRKFLNKFAEKAKVLTDRYFWTASPVAEGLHATHVHRKDDG